jgi:hypothetical protein
MKLTLSELEELNRTGVWHGRHKRRFPSQNGNSHQRRKVRRASWREYEKRHQEPRAFIFFVDPTNSFDVTANSPFSIFVGDTDTSTKQTENSKSFKYPTKREALKRGSWIDDSDAWEIDLTRPDGSAKNPYPPKKI